MSDPFYAAALLALRDTDETRHIGVSIAILHPSHMGGDELALRAAREYFPAGDGWGDHFAAAHALDPMLVDTIAAEAGLPFRDDRDRRVMTLLTVATICERCGGQMHRIEPDIEDEA